MFHIENEYFLNEYDTSVANTHNNRHHIGSVQTPTILQKWQPGQTHTRNIRRVQYKLNGGSR